MTSRALDTVLPRYRHREVHATVARATPEAVWAALHATTAGELALTRVLTRLRGLAQPETGTPFLQGLTRRFDLLVQEPGRLLVAGGAGQPWKPRGGRQVHVRDIAELAAFAEPGYVLMAVSFELQPAGAGRTRLVTETRVQPTDRRAALAFAPYWLVVRCGSGLIRRDVLRAVRRRAEDQTRKSTILGSTSPGASSTQKCPTPGSSSSR